MIIVARSSSKTTKKKADVVEGELDELEDLEDLEDLDDLDDEEPEDEVEDDEEEEDDEDEEDEVPVRKRRAAKATPVAAPVKQSRSRTTDGKVGTQELANHLGIDGRSLRMLLRKKGIKVDPETGRYEWKSLNDPTVKKIIKAHKSGETDEIKRESLDALKNRNKPEPEPAPKAKRAKKSTAKATPAKKRRRVVEEDEDSDE